MKKTLLVLAFAFALVGVGASNASAYTFSTDLSLGSTHADVSALQDMLIAGGYLQMPAGVSKGYFGALTKAAVQKWQAANMITPAAGYFGPISRARASMGGSVSTGNFPAGCTSAVGYSVTTGVKCSTTTSNPNPSTGGLEGGAGDITVDDLSTYSNESVQEGEEEAKVLAFEVEADDESDIEVTSIKLEFVQNTSADSEDLTDYAESVSVWLDGEMVGEVDAEDFSENSDVYTKSVSLDGAVIEAGDTVKFVVAVNALSNLDSGDIDTDAWVVDVLQVRFVDAEDVSSTESTDADGLEQSFDFEDLATSGDLEAKITENDDSPEAGVVSVDDTSDTNDVLLLAVDFSAEGSDMTVDELSFDITPTGANANVIVSEYKLVVNGEEIDSISATSIASTVTGTIQFTDLEDEFEVSEDDEAVIELFADINDLEGTFGNGDSILASLTSTDFGVASTTIEDANGDTVAAGDRTGSVTGETQTFYADGISVSLVSVDDTSVTVDGSDNDRAELEIVFKVAAFGTDAYIPSFMTPTTNGTNATVGTASASTSPSTASGVAFHVQSSDTDLTIARLGASTLTSTASEETNSFKVNEGDEETFTLKVVVTNAATSLLDGSSVRALLKGVNFATSDTATGAFVYTSDLSDTFKTGFAVIAD